MSATATAKWLILCQNHLKAYKELRAPERELMKQFKDGIAEVKENLREFCEQFPAFVYEDSFGCAKAGIKKAKLASKVDLAKSILVINHALRENQDQTLSAERLQEMQQSIATDLQSDLKNEAESTMVRISKNKRKHTGQLQPLSNSNISARIHHLLKKIPPCIILKEEEEQEENEEEKQEENEEEVVAPE